MIDFGLNKPLFKYTFGNFSGFLAILGVRVLILEGIEFLEFDFSILIFFMGSWGGQYVY
ncbi:MAG: hypothetical protein WCW30_00355 [Candidatus Gracilibacteria bacterium]